LKPALQKIYPITDRALSGLSIAEQVRNFIEGGATLIQIRDKNAASDQLFNSVTAAVKIAHKASVAVLVNDRVDIALMSGADGVHLGQDDLPVTAARRILGDDAVIGVSTHSEKQVREALADGSADYIAFGPIFPTSTKKDHDPLVGIQALSRIRDIVGDKLPLVAIGGINVYNLASAIRAGADSAAMISEFYQSKIGISSQFASLLRTAESVNTVVPA
jgi:thiamine-phosphate pyrophosphorylase